MYPDQTGPLGTFMFHKHITCFFHDLQREADKNNHRAVIPVVHYSEMSMTDQITWLNTFAYRVGQLGAIR